MRTGKSTKTPKVTISALRKWVLHFSVLFSKLFLSCAQQLKINEREKGARQVIMATKNIITVSGGGGGGRIGDIKERKREKEREREREREREGGE